MLWAQSGWGGTSLSKVMIVDDDRTTVKLLQTLLELDGYEIVVAGRGGDVMDTAYASLPEIFLMDYHLSDMDGVDIIRQLRKTDEFSKTPIIMTSGLDVEEEALAAGANVFLVKPFEPDDLPALFNRLLAE